MRFFPILPMLFFVTVAACALSAETVPQNVVSMWDCPMPLKGVPGAGFEEVPGIEHHRIFDGTMETGGYNHHAAIIYYKGLFYAMWSNQHYAEDAPGQKVFYSVSKDAKNWSPHRTLFPSLQPERSWEGTGINLSANRWEVHGGRLYARGWCGATVAWEDVNGDQSAVRSKQFNHAVRKHYDFLYRSVSAGGTLGPIASFNHQELPSDILYPVHKASAVYPDLEKIKHMPDTAEIVKTSGRRLTEPAFYQAADGDYVILFRDANYSHRKWVSFSKDGKTWSPAVPTDIPDSPSATFAMTLDSGTILLFGNHMAPKFDSASPRHYGRDPLTVSISTDGKHFTKTYAVRSGQTDYSVPVKQVKGRGGGAQYSKAILVKNTVYVIYSMGKEDVWISMFSLDTLISEDASHVSESN